MLTRAKHPTMTAPKKKQSPQHETNSEYIHVSGFAGLEDSKKHLQELPPIGFILPQLCAHGALKVIKQL